jgi:hypothetical protein
VTDIALKYSKIELTLACTCGARVSSVGINRQRLPQLMAAFDAAHTEGCRGEPLFEAFPGALVEWAGRTVQYEKDGEA